MGLSTEFFGILSSVGYKDFQQLSVYNSPAWAGKFLDIWLVWNSVTPLRDTVPLTRIGSPPPRTRWSRHTRLAGTGLLQLCLWLLGNLCLAAAPALEVFPNHFLLQMERILEIDSLQEVTKAIVEAARESLAIGQT